MMFLLGVIFILEAIFACLILRAVYWTFKDWFEVKIIKRFFPKYYYYDWDEERR